ncbi:YdeI/OmpD-associated family protein [Roseinatronobacter sp. S2]|uniref:YdeI/OmpD-associated family protein n=1 Tax=Roseinatronobacter sp. S2 TaxID=3035471 RepID=UPI00240F4C0C|nr:YdeI/OmpD-associated family protein [Roseinatronobacter sp. S2]WFE73605.1 YdeI/OmpD-associated family protein [Roseinatronobacter sp. S2]
MARPREAMPQDVADALQSGGLCDAYAARPPYQRNDWLIWINGAKRPETRARRLAAMLAELRAGRGYMGMPWQPRGTGKQN